MPLDSTEPDLTSGDPGNSRHTLPAPIPVGAEVFARHLSPDKMAALRALIACGKVSKAAKSCGVNRSTVYDWLKNDAHFRAAFNAWKEELYESGRARLLKSADVAISNVIKAVAKGDTHAALALLKGIGMLSPQRIGLTDPAMLNREMELDRRQQRLDLANRSNQVASDEENRFSRVVGRIEDEERWRREAEREQHRKQEEQDDQESEEEPKKR